jgi:hypothetical protein
MIIKSSRVLLCATLAAAMIAAAMSSMALAQPAGQAQIAALKAEISKAISNCDEELYNEAAEDLDNLYVRLRMPGATQSIPPYTGCEQRVPVHQTLYTVELAGFYRGVSTAFSTPSSTLKIHANAPVLGVGGAVETPMGLILSGGFGFTPTAGGSFTEGTASGDVAGGQTFMGHADAGFTVVRGPGFSAGGFFGYGLLHEHLSGTTPGSDTQFQLLDQTWQSVRVGLGGGVGLPGNLHFDGAVDFRPWVQAQTAGFTGTGTGYDFSGMVWTTMPGINGLRVGVFAQYSHLGASGDLVESPGFPAVGANTKNDSVTIGVKADLINFVLDFPLTDTWTLALP